MCLCVNRDDCGVKRYIQANPLSLCLTGAPPYCAILCCFLGLRFCFLWVWETEVELEFRAFVCFPCCCGYFPLAEHWHTFSSNHAYERWASVCICTCKNTCSRHTCVYLFTVTAHFKQERLFAYLFPNYNHSDASVV